ncbi:MAG: sugar phosphate nucleotidyltransferase [Candidatus Obscuribacterales bacterium]
MKVIILAGGLGTRLMEETVVKPKPMVEVGGRPIIWHIMNIYGHYGFKEFIVALGYKGEVIKSYFLDQYYLENDFSINLADGKEQVHAKASKDWLVHLIDTGAATQTSGRIARLRKWINNETFMLTYGNGVASINIKELVAYHKERQQTGHSDGSVMRPLSEIQGAQHGSENMHINDFIEKPQMGEGWINGGFFVLEPQVDYLGGDSEIFERAPLQKLAEDNQLVAFKHDGFWQCMDTLRDVRLLEGL